MWHSTMTPLLQLTGEDHGVHFMAQKNESAICITILFLQMLYE